MLRWLILSTLFAQSILAARWNLDKILDGMCHLNCDESLEIGPYTCTQNLFLVAKLLHLEAIRLHAWINIWTVFNHFRNHYSSLFTRKRFDSLGNWLWHAREMTVGITTYKVRIFKGHIILRNLATLKSYVKSVSDWILLNDQCDIVTCTLNFQKDACIFHTALSKRKIIAICIWTFYVKMSEWNKIKSHEMFHPLERESRRLYLKKA